MTINPLSSSIINLLTEQPDTAKVAAVSEIGAGSSFSNVLSETFAVAAEADAADKISAVELLAGQSDDLPGIMLDVQKADLALNLSLQIRNKVVDAYNEIMRMQV